MEEGNDIYKQDCANLANPKIGVGCMPWIQDELITSSNPSIYTNRFSFPWNHYDVNLAQRVSLLAYLMWHNHTVNFQVGTLYYTSHGGPELAQSTADRAAFPPVDRSTNEGWVSLEFCNGRFRLRSEFDWFFRKTRYSPSLDGTFFGFNDQPVDLLPGRVRAQMPPGAPHVQGSGSPFGAQYVESTRFMVDASIPYGPVMLTAFCSHMPGPDRRHGILIKKQPFINTIEQAGLDPFYKYSSLLAFRFGGGVNSPGDLSDAFVVAGKIDYALAANLNLRATYLHAWRVSHGYGWGWIRPSLIQSRFGQVDYDPGLRAYLAQAVPGPRNPFTENIPAIPTRDLGWEVNAGITWQLLNQFVAALNFSLWKPGKWFSYACVDKSVPGWNNPSAANRWGVNPDRTIDPILGLEFALLSSFLAEAIREATRS